VLTSPRANQGVRDHFPLWQSVGILAPEVESRKKQFAELAEDSEVGHQRRLEFEKAVHGTRFEYQGAGIEMNQRYTSDAIYLSDQGVAPQMQRDPVLYYQKSTYPGSRLPHAWLCRSPPSKLVSTHDLAGKGRFTIFTGPGGEGWTNAAAQVNQTLGTPIAVYSIGFRRDYADTYLDWSRLREVDESGCILVRPDRFIAWRCMKLPEDHTDRLLLVMRHILAIR
jgi:hypothetical protein